MYTLSLLLFSLESHCWWMRNEKVFGELVVVVVGGKEKILRNVTWVLGRGGLGSVAKAFD